jgi:coxsackievirus/adenovirus receptor
VGREHYNYAWLFLKLTLFENVDEEIVPAETPAFHGQSFVELKKMKAQDKFAMEIEFKSLLTDGILLYAQQRKDFDADYISLAIIAG